MPMRIEPGSHGPLGHRIGPLDRSPFASKPDFSRPKPQIPSGSLRLTDL